MTKGELAAIVEAKGVKVKARCLRPNRYYLPCSFLNGDHYLNEICLRRWSGNGEQIVFMLDSHNFHFVAPDEIMEVVPIRRDYALPQTLINQRNEYDRRAMANRPGGRR